MVQILGEGTYPHVELGESDALHVGDFVVALGHSKGFDPERRAPIRMGRLCTDGKQRFLISECTLIGGDSGGPPLRSVRKAGGHPFLHWADAENQQPCSRFRLPP